MIDLTLATRGDAHLIEAMLDRYLAELASHRERPVGAIDAASYRYLDAYCSEPGRHAFLIRRNDQVVGFALIRGPESTGSATSQVAEFYIAAEFRRLGVGRCAAAAIWRRFPGTWELQIHRRNAAAVRFWSSCVATESGHPPEIRVVDAADGGRLQLNFRVGDRP